MVPIIPCAGRWLVVGLCPRAVPPRRYATRRAQAGGHRRRTVAERGAVAHFGSLFRGLAWRPECSLCAPGAARWHSCRLKPERGAMGAPDMPAATQRGDGNCPTTAWAPARCGSCACAQCFCNCNNLGLDSHSPSWWPVFWHLRVLESCRHCPLSCISILVGGVAAAANQWCNYWW